MSVSTAITLVVKTRSESASRPYPAAPTAHPTMSAPETSSQAWNHSTVLSTYGFTMTVNSVANWYTRLSSSSRRSGTLYGR